MKYIEISISRILKYDIIGLLRTKLLTFKVMNSLKSFQFFFNRTQMLAIQFMTAFLWKIIVTRSSFKLATKSFKQISISWLLLRFYFVLLPFQCLPLHYPKRNQLKCVKYNHVPIYEGFSSHGKHNYSNHSINLPNVSVSLLCFLYFRTRTLSKFGWVNYVL